jgi:hypothetical protein
MDRVYYSGFVDNPQDIHRTSVHKSVETVDNVGKPSTISCVKGMSIPESSKIRKLPTLSTNKYRL